MKNKAASRSSGNRSFPIEKLRVRVSAGGLGFLNATSLE